MVILGLGLQPGFAFVFHGLFLLASFYSPTFIHSTKFNHPLLLVYFTRPLSLDDLIVSSI